MAGRVAPFIELGVGFNVELTARENIVLNGVLMGLTREQAEARIDAVIEFAELEEFVDLKLKNYSSGMLVRLAFSVMIQSDADILLIDEVLAVGDASFQQKCKDVFHEMRGSDRTVVLVTHDMAAVEQFCHRAMLLDGGEIVADRRRPTRSPSATCGSTSPQPTGAARRPSGRARRRRDPPARRLARVRRRADQQRRAGRAARVPRGVRGADRDPGPELRLRRSPTTRASRSAASAPGSSRRPTTARRT